MNLQGVVYRLGDTQEVGANGFKKRDVVIEIDRDSQYPQKVQFQVIKDNCEKAEDLQPGTEVSIDFNIQGREWTNKDGVVVFFNTLQIWRFNVLRSASIGSGGGSTAQYAPNPNLGNGGDDDLPF